MRSLQDDSAAGRSDPVMLTTEHDVCVCDVCDVQGATSNAGDRISSQCVVQSHYELKAISAAAVSTTSHENYRNTIEQGNVR